MMQYRFSGFARGPTVVRAPGDRHGCRASQPVPS